MDCAGLSVLVFVCAEGHRRGEHVTLTGPSETISRLLRLGGLDVNFGLQRPAAWPPLQRSQKSVHPAASPVAAHGSCQTGLISDLLLRCGRDDEEAFALLFDTFHPLAHAITAALSHRRTLTDPSGRRHHNLVGRAAVSPRWGELGVLDHAA